MIIRPMTPDDILGAVALQRACFPPPFPEELLWRAEHLARHLELFPEGQFVSVDTDNAIWGSASSVLISEENYNAHRNWDTTVGGPFLNAHDPHGTTLYGVDISVHPEARRQGIARRLYHARFAVVRELGLRRFATACRIPDFRTWRQEPGDLAKDLERYINDVVWDKASDRTLSPLLHIGLKPVCGILDYMEDEESLDCAVLLKWKPTRPWLGPEVIDGDE
jgi:ribosomal protein S18 acetylase RimI-like enzyme